MDLRLFWKTFTAIFVAELGDKTQLAALSFAAGGSSRWIVFFGASLALIASTAIAVLVGGGLAKVIPPIWLKRGAGALFIVMGVLFLLAKPEAAPAAPPK